MLKKRTDLAQEAREIWQESAGETSALQGVEAKEEQQDGCGVTRVRILSEEGARALEKPVGNYITVSFPAEDGGDLNSRAALLGREIRQLLDLRPGQSVLVVGLGNEAITPDAVGPRTAKGILVTRHLVDALPDTFGQFRPVSVLSPGVLGTTGLESGEIIRGVAERSAPDKVLVVDALASCRLERLCSTVQLADTGIVPGSGVGNSRAAINRQTLGVDVLAVGVPTVVDAATLVADMLGRQEEKEALGGWGKGVIVTPRDIDKFVGDISKLLSLGINMALHDNLSPDDINGFLS
ncbi:MAG: GPR endopeptidase [Oscillospiraceae bacterium]|nr:GPR endopeptidase [Oscillospiraceae bacterium]